MKIHYNITKEQRKKMVEVVGKALGTTASYCGAPTFAYKVGSGSRARAHGASGRGIRRGRR